MSQKKIFMETTEIAPEKTVSEIEQVLMGAGATAILKEFEKGEIAAVSFRVRANGQDLPFRLPCRWKAVQMALAMRKETFKERWNMQERYPWAAEEVKKALLLIEPQAKRVAWRQILRWIQAQIALVETEMVRVEEVFMPYMQLRTGQTLYEMVQGKNFLLEDQR